MTFHRHALVLSDDPADVDQWRDANRSWLTEASPVFYRAAKDGVPRDRAGAPISDAAIRDMSGGFLLTRSDWRVDSAFGEIAAEGGFAVATGRLVSRKLAASGAVAYGDIAPALVAADIERFSISARYDGFLCRRLPLECLWIGAEVAADALALLASGGSAEAVLETISVDQRLIGGGRLAYLADMKALWRRAGDVKNCASLRRES